MSLNELLKENLLKEGATIVGFADLSPIPEEMRKGYPYGISIGLIFSPEVVAGISSGPNLQYYEETNKLNQFLNTLDLFAAEMIKDAGFDAFPLTQANVRINKKMRTRLPYKTVATRAGLGWIGKSNLLVTRDYGSALRISSVVTNAPLEPGPPVTESKCGNCRKCSDICPADAIAGYSWNPQKDRDELFNADACYRTAKELSGVIGVKEILCGLCIFSCPWTKKFLKKQSRKE